MCTVSGGSYVGALSCFWGCVSQCFIFKVHAGVLCGYSSTYVCVCVCVLVFFCLCAHVSMESCVWVPPSVCHFGVWPVGSAVQRFLSVKLMN